MKGDVYIIYRTPTRPSVFNWGIEVGEKVTEDDKRWLINIRGNKVCMVGSKLQLDCLKKVNISPFEIEE
jgi:hypothetical protein